MSTAEKWIDLQNDIKRHNRLMVHTSEEVLNNKVTKYPIFIVHRQVMDMGVPILVHNQDAHPWSIHISSLEEFHVKGLISEDKIADFISVYKDPKAYFCVFAISELGAQFIFISQ